MISQGGLENTPKKRKKNLTENTPSSAIEAHMHDEIEAMEKQLKEKKVADNAGCTLYR
jgi:hypothetical protein